MSGYGYAWIIIFASAGLGAFGLWKLCARTRYGLLPWLATSLALTFFLTPISVPNYPEQIAPAFVVAVFELLFQTNGEPQASLRLLALTLGLVCLLTLLIYYFTQKTSRDSKPERGGS